jgi:hypothetical protein
LNLQQAFFNREKNRLEWKACVYSPNRQDFRQDLGASVDLQAECSVNFPPFFDFTDPLQLAEHP